jgi:hypothetical protein
MDCSGGSVATFDAPDGGIGSAVLFGSSSGTVQMMYGECFGGCTTLGNWSTLNLGVGYAVTLVTDKQNLPRAYFNVSGHGTGGTAFRRCTARPCTVIGNWSAAATLNSAAGYVDATVTDAGTVVFVNGASSTLFVGTESGSSYAMRAITGCDGGTTNLTGAYPQGLLGPSNKVRVFFGGTSGNYGPTRYFFEGP